MKKILLAFFMAWVLMPSVFAANTKVYTKLNGSEMVVAQGGKITMQAGSTLTVAGTEYHGAAGFISTFTAATGAQTWTGAIASLASMSAPAATISGTGASALDVAGGINAGSGNVGIVDTSGKIPAISSTYFASLSGANLTGVPAAAVTGTAAILGANSFTAEQSVVGGVRVSTSATSVFKCLDVGAVEALPTTTYTECDQVWLTSDHTLYRATETVVGAYSWKAVW